MTDDARDHIRGIAKADGSPAAIRFLVVDAVATKIIVTADKITTAALKWRRAGIERWLRDRG